MTPLDLVLVTLLAAAGACVQASVGFGLGLLTAPLLGLIDPAFVPGPVLMTSLPLSAMVAWRERGHVDRSGLGWALSGRVPGTVAAAVALAVLPESETAILFAVMVLVAVALSMVGWSVRPTPRTLVTAGLASGFMGTTSGIGGPPMALVYQHEHGPRLRSTLAAYFVVGTVFSLAALGVAGKFGWRQVLLGLALLPGMAVGFWLSGPVGKHLDRGRTRAAVLVLSSVAAVAVLAETLW